MQQVSPSWPCPQSEPLSALRPPPPSALAVAFGFGPAKAAAGGPPAGGPPAAAFAGPKPNATAKAEGGGGLSADRGSDWGHGHEGETCCMCSYQYGGPTGTVVIYAAGDYDNDQHWGGSHGAFWHCEHECEQKCGLYHGAHKFGCLDEGHLRSLSRSLTSASGFRIAHQHRFGNLC
mmetsp:Transcript_4247/g.13455  ORF Transcript_4247/g.13455 Transcript_4247/m.13455 type:complete len:176 (-) Transcript_4247:82-609(-)